jgi:hypothetical protein
MNLRLAPLVLLSTVTFLTRAQERSIPSDTKIDKVIVFLNGAQIERSSTVTLPSGASSILFQDLSPEIEEQSIQVKGAGNFTILSVSRQSNFLHEQKANDKVKSLEQRLSELNDQADIKQNNILILKKEEDLLAANQSVGNGGAGLDLNKLKQVLEFQRARLTENKLKQLDNEKATKRIREEMVKVQKQIKEVKDQTSNNTSDIEVKVNAKAPLTGTFKITYLIKNATWYPSYDIRATEVNKPVDLIYRANVSQHSGEEWKNVKLVLSSGDPSRGGNKPTLKPYQIGYNVANYTADASISRVSGRITSMQDGLAIPGASIRVKGTSIGTVADANGNYSIQIPSANSILVYSFIGYEFLERPVRTAVANVRLKEDQQALNEIVIADYSPESDPAVSAALAGKASGVLIRGMSSVPSSVPLQVAVQQNQTTVQFEVAQPYTILSDGKQLAVELAAHHLAADYNYYAVPKISEDAYLTASLKGINELNLMSGEANIFFEGAFLGKTLIDVQDTNDTLTVSLGVDKNLLVKRIQQKDQNDKSLIGSNLRATRSFTYQILSRKATPVTLNLEDQIPVSTSSDVTVEKLELSNASLDANSGSLSWKLQLQPNEKKEFKLTYQVKYPKNRPVQLE